MQCRCSTALKRVYSENQEYEVVQAKSLPALRSFGQKGGKMRLRNGGVSNLRTGLESCHDFITRVAWRLVYYT